MMVRRTVVLFAAWSTLVMIGCSELRNDLPATVQSIETEECETCHSLLPKTESHYEHIIDTATLDSIGRILLPLKCKECHLGYDDDSGWVVDSMHRNGIVDIRESECDYCHAYRRDCGWCHALPPMDTDRQRKVHRHVSEQHYNCGVCHKGYDAEMLIAPVATHDNGTIDVSFDNAPQKYGVPTAPYYSNDSCYNLYCHGAVTAGGKPAVAVTDVEPTGKEQCNFCHNITQLQALVYDHSLPDHQNLYEDCLNCHKNFSYNLQTVDDSTHFNGVIDTSKVSCNECHNVPIP
ncbi:MAG: hypothetical protein JW863_18665 [Chitinispirillaceae bacterium]|nr:hypothetical protein [Chitinispirillaceae bacterium]